MARGVEVRSIDGMLPLMLYVGGEYLAGEFDLDQPLTFLSFESLDRIFGLGLLGENPA